MTKKIVAQNRKAKFEYSIEESFEAGIVLCGTEVKSLRLGKASIAESFANEENNEIWLLNCHIDEYSKANLFNHDPKRKRKLLLHKKQINKLMGKVKLKGYSIIPISIYFNEKNIAKIEIGLARGKAKQDKRASIKEREWNRSKDRILKHNQ